jgi:hypothetical protein
MELHDFHPAPGSKRSSQTDQWRNKDYARKQKKLGKNPVPEPLRLQRISYEVIRDRKRDSAMMTGSGLSPWKLGFNPRPVRVGFVADKVTVKSCLF